MPPQCFGKMISSCCSVVTVLFTRLSIFQNFYTSSLCFSFPLPTLKKRRSNPWDSLSVQHESNLEYRRRHRGSLSVFFRKKTPPPPKKKKKNAQIAHRTKHTLMQKHATRGQRKESGVGFDLIWFKEIQSR